jgi:phosphatidate cytidylyltransferase
LLPARILTAAVLLAGFLGALFWLDRAQFACVIALVVVIAAHEWAGLSGISGAGRPLYAVGTGLVYGALAIAWLDGIPATWLLATAALFWILAVPFWLWRGVTSGARRLLAPVGLLVIVPAGAAMLALSPGQLLAVLALTWVADTTAFFVGRAWGRRKLAPGISPGKTLEGAAGAVVGVSIYAIICATLLPDLQQFARGAAWLAILAAAVLLAVMSILGDLFESAIKRQAGAKDSGTLLPGHGGVLDRIDSATSTLPVAALLFHWALMP